MDEQDAAGSRPWWQPPPFQPLNPSSLDWLAETCGPGARIVSRRSLKGGISSAVDGFTIETSAGRRERVVLRRYLYGDELREEGAENIRREAALLELLTDSGIPVPRLIATDPEGLRSGGAPSLLMSRLPGQVFLRPREPEQWLGQMAKALAAIHALQIDANLGMRTAGSREYAPHAWQETPSIWREAEAAVATVPAVHHAGFIHGDYQHFNLLWRRERLTGVIDWLGAKHGPQDSDVGHCELNLAVLFGPDWCNRFRLAYESEAGRKVDPWWELRMLMNYSPEWQGFIPIQVGGRALVDVAGMTGRVEEAIAAVLRRL